MACGSSQLPPQQLHALQGLVNKHIGEAQSADFVDGADFTHTSTERCLQRWEQAHLVAALDVLNAYQSNRRARAACQVAGYFPGRRRQFKDDPRTRAVEFLKRWLRTHAGDKAVAEDEVRSVSGFCRDLLNHPELFPARNPRSFLRTVAEVYEHLQWQLREVLERDRTCAELTHRVLSLSRNLVSDALCYLLLAPTDLRQTDGLPSLEVVALWQSLPEEGHPLRGRADPALQRQMREAWRSRCGGLLAAVLSAPPCLGLFKAAGAEEEVAAIAEQPEAAGAASPPAGPAPSVQQLAAEARAQFERGDFRSSGLAGAFRAPAQAPARERYLEAAQALADLVYLLGEVLTQFHRVSDGLGDYGAIRVAPWLHPFLEAVVEKVLHLKSRLEQLNQAVDGVYVLARARGAKVEKPSPSKRMSARAHAAIERAVTGRDSHVQVLLQTVEELKARSSPERLPHVVEGLGDACSSLQRVLASSEFRAHVGDTFPELPVLGSPPVHTEARASGRGLPPQPGAGPAAGLEEPEVQAAQRGGLLLQLEDIPTDPSKECEVTYLDSGKAGEPAPAGGEAAAGPQGCEVWAEVDRMAPLRCGGRLHWHDRRSLLLSGGRLVIFQPGSAEKVKTAVDVESGIEACRLGPGGLLSVAVQRPPAGAARESGVAELKEYHFEFPSVRAAAAFHKALRAHRAEWQD